VLRQHLNETDSILEIGSGSVGLGKFYRAAFVGCDVAFAVKPQPPMFPVMATAANLPFADRSFDGVIASDVLEHIPPGNRTSAIAEALRVARKLVIFGFPSGNAAFDCDRKLAEVYDRRLPSRPTWLEEHICYGFPDEKLFDDFRTKWQVSSFGNESVGFHFWMMNKEMSSAWDFGFRLLMALAPGAAEGFLKRADREPFYRRIVILRPKDPSAAALHES
jgi:hypothetical protein